MDTFKTVAPRARWIANGLTLALAAFGAWGWFCDQLMSIESRAALALITLLTQQAANVAAAGAATALKQGQRFCAVGATVLTLMFAAASGYAVHHALDVVDRHRIGAIIEARAGERTDLHAAIGRTERERAAAQASLSTIPIDLPTRRIVALQRPLDAAIERTEVRLSQLRAEIAELSRPPARSPAEAKQADMVALLFWALALGEPGLYWLLAALQRPTGRHVPRPAPDVPRQKQRPPGLSRRLTAPLAAALAGAHAILGGVAAAEDGVRTETVARDSEDRRTDAHSAPAPWDMAGPQAQARKLHARGVSVRRIAAQLGVCSKSTIHRWLSGARSR
jgi:hypothetical protein